MHILKIHTCSCNYCVRRTHTQTHRLPLRQQTLLLISTTWENFSPWNVLAITSWLMINSVLHISLERNEDQPWIGNVQQCYMSMTVLTRRLTTTTPLKADSGYIVVNQQWTMLAQPSPDHKGMLLQTGRIHPICCDSLIKAYAKGGKHVLCVCVCVCVCMHGCVWVCVHAYVWVCVCGHACVHVCVLCTPNELKLIIC